MNSKGPPSRFVIVAALDNSTLAEHVLDEALAQTQGKLNADLQTE